MSASRLIRAGEPTLCHPAVRYVLTQAAWFDMAHALPTEPGLAFVALWADATSVHALFLADEPLLASVAVEAGLYAALSPARPGAALFERAIADLWGHQAADAADVRPWLDHGTWPMLRPLSDRPAPNSAAPHAAIPEPERPEMIATPGDTLPFGPLPSGLTPLSAPGLWHATLVHDRVERLEARFGWGHRGVAGLVRAKSPAGAARFVARLDGTATVAHSIAFAGAVEAAVQTDAPPAAQGLRRLLLALERAATRLHTLAATAQAIGPAFPAAWPAALAAREALLEACAAVFGHRLLMDVVRPGGVNVEPSTEALLALDTTLAGLDGVGWLRAPWPEIGALSIASALELGLPGPAGRAAGRLDPAAPTARLIGHGTLSARMTLHAEAIAEDIEAARTALANLPAGPVQAVLPHHAAEGLGCADGAQGPVWHWVRLANGVVADWGAAGPEWLLLPALERAAQGLAVDHLAGHIASFAVHPAGLDQ